PLQRTPATRRVRGQSEVRDSGASGEPRPRGGKDPVGTSCGESYLRYAAAGCLATEKRRQHPLACSLQTRTHCTTAKLSCASRALIAGADGRARRAHLVDDLEAAAVRPPERADILLVLLEDREGPQ